MKIARSLVRTLQQENPLEPLSHRGGVSDVFAALLVRLGEPLLASVAIEAHNIHTRIYTPALSLSLCQVVTSL